MANNLPSGWKATKWEHATPMGTNCDGDEARAGFASAWSVVAAFAKGERDDVTWVCRWAEAPKRTEAPDTCRVVREPTWFEDGTGRKWATVWLYAEGVLTFLPRMQLVAMKQGESFDYVEAVTKESNDVEESQSPSEPSPDASQTMNIGPSGSETTHRTQ